MTPTAGPAVRGLTAADLPDVQRIYAYAVEHTDATLDVEPKSLADLETWLAAHGDRYPAVGVHDGVSLVGYASLSPFAARGGYFASAEISVYVAPERQGSRIGTALCVHLTEQARAVGLSTVVALVTSTNAASRRLFAAAGYDETGTLRSIGYKRGRLVDLVVLQRLFLDNAGRFDGSPLEQIFAEELT